MFKHRGWIILLLLAAAAVAIGRGCGCADPGRHVGASGRVPAGGSRVPATAPQRAVADVAAAPAGDGEGAKGRAARRTNARPAAADGTVVRVRDGDSIVVMRGGVGIEVRLDGIDCPELAQEFGRKAKSATSALVYRKQVRLAGRGKDRYDRELAEVFLPDGRSLNRELVAAGFAWWYRRHSTDLSLEAAEREARMARRGLWADRDPVPPWDFRESVRRRPGGGA